MHQSRHLLDRLPSTEGVDAPRGEPLGAVGLLLRDALGVRHGVLAAEGVAQPRELHVGYKVRQLADEAPHQLFAGGWLGGDSVGGQGEAFRRVRDECDPVPEGHVQRSLGRLLLFRRNSPAFVTALRGGGWKLVRHRLLLLLLCLCRATPVAVMVTVLLVLMINVSTTVVLGICLGIDREWVTITLCKAAAVVVVATRTGPSVHRRDVE